MSVKTSPFALRPGLTLFISLFLGSLMLAVGLASVPPSAHATTTTLAGYSATLWRAERARVHPIDSRSDATDIRSLDVVTTYVYLPIIARAEVCQPIPDESYDDFPVNGDPTDPPAEEHPDLNLALLGYEPTDAYKGLVDYSGGADPNGPPQLPGLFADNRTPTFSAVYQLYSWDWDNNRRGPLITNPEVTVAGLAGTPGETIHVPDSGYTIGGGYEVLVLYASNERITLKYTPDDHVVYGYTLHVENICVEPSLLALYQSWNEAGRSRLPALRAGQAFGRARGSEIGVAIRDTGSPMDPRSRKDWWQGR